MSFSTPLTTISTTLTLLKPTISWANERASNFEADALNGFTEIQEHAAFDNSTNRTPGHALRDRTRALGCFLQLGAASLLTFDPVANIRYAAKAGSAAMAVLDPNALGREDNGTGEEKAIVQYAAVPVEFAGAYSGIYLFAQKIALLAGGILALSAYMIIAVKPNPGCSYVLRNAKKIMRAPLILWSPTGMYNLVRGR